ncbi:MAG: hypothetical protein RIB57_02470 [Pelagibacterium sp.]|jgi:hypothetical protein|tara:strand:+ start:10469 stop:10615 length:147 start_codon:yes stop_codon:yes gene_type:complete
MNMLPRAKAAAMAIGNHMDRIRLYRALSLHRNADTLLPLARRHLGLSE